MSAADERALRELAADIHQSRVDLPFDIADTLYRAVDELDLLRVQLGITTRLLRDVWAYGNMSPLDGGTMNRIGNYLGLNE